MEKDIIRAGEICKEIKKEIIPTIKKGDKLIEIAEKIEKRIIELGGKPAFPVNVSINEIAAHYTPIVQDESLAEGLIKIDFGAQVNGWCADTAFSLDLEGDEENKKMIKANEDALEEAIKLIQEKKNKTTLKDIGEKIENSINEKGFTPIINLSGHSMDEYDLHSGLTILNKKNNILESLETGLFAIEPFATKKNASAKVKDGAFSQIYCLISNKSIRDNNSRKILEYIMEEYSTLPFCLRWIVEKFGESSRIAINRLVLNENLHNFPLLIESSKEKVSQAEETIFINKKNEVIVTTKI